MQGNLYLQIADAFLTFTLQAGAACLVCLCFTRLLRRPEHRFMVWLVFLFASGFYWLALTGKLVFSILRPSTFMAGSRPEDVPELGRFLVPASWMIWLEWLIAAAGCAYLAGLLWLAYRQVRRSIGLRTLVKTGSQPSPAIAQLLKRICHEFGVRRCKLLVVPELISPSTVYWWKPCILLPETCDGEEATPQLEDVLRHELVHVMRRDYFFSGISDAICALLFFHPVAWHARKQMRLERELACDLAVVKERPDRRADYADTLAHFVRLHMLRQRSASRGIDFAGSVGFLARRIRCILAEPGRTPWWKKLSKTGAGFMMWAAFAVCAPALAVVLDSAAVPDSAAKLKEPQPISTAVQHRASLRPHALKRSGNQASPASLPDTLTSLRVHDQRDEGEGFQSYSSISGGGTSGGPDVNSRTWKERSPASTRSSRPSIRSIVLATIGGVAGSERKERGHGHER